MNSPSVSLGTIVRNYSHTVHVPRVLAAAAIRGRHLSHSELWIVCLLFKGSNYLRAASVQRNTVHIMDFLFLQAHYDDGRRDQRYLRQKVQQLYSVQFKF